MKNQSSRNTAGTNTASWTNTQVYTAIVVVLLVGGIGGYLLHSSGTPAENFGTSAPAAPGPSVASPTLTPDQILDTQAKPLQQRLNTNPKDVSALTELGNLYFDASQWTTAIGYYTRALNETPTNTDVRTDMGIAYYSSGDADRALREFDQALRDDPRHVQTLFNVGVVKLQGKNDPKGAIAAWESLLKIDPAYRDRTKVESLLAEARAKLK